LHKHIYMKPSLSIALYRIYLPYARLFITLICSLLTLFSLPAFSQTSGLIVKPAAAGKAVLDPNGDGYVSASNAGFVANDQLESEIPYKRLTVQEAEPTSDLANGPSCGFTDFVDAANIDPVSSYLSPAGNLMFRFRLGGYAPNAKGYSILIDTDNRFGSSGSNADPNYVAGNPGFEVEIELVTNFGVRLYNTDGTANPTLLTTLPYDDYAQKSIAFTTNCADADYFYDFYMPFSTITSFIPSFTSSTPVRMVANTIISTQSALKGPISDIGGVDDRKYGGNVEKAWSALIDASVPTPLSTISAGNSFPPVRSATPVINGPIASGATTISGTSSEPNGTVIEIFINGTSAGTATVSGGTWTRSGLTALASGASITATATAPGKSVSLASPAVIVGSSCSSPITGITCTSAKGIGGTVASGTPENSTIRVYNANGTVLATVSTRSDFTFLYNCAGGTTNCTGGGPNCITSGTYSITLQESGKCESAPSFVCTGGIGTTAAPVINTPPTLTPGTTSISGTAVMVATIYLYRDGYRIASTTADIMGNWSVSGLSFALGQVITARAATALQCLSAASVARTVSDVSTPPVVNGPIINGATSVSGTSGEAAGTVITVFRNGTSLGTTTVNANGGWTLTGIATALATSNSITATATAPGKTVSALSAAVVVQASTTAVPAITGSYTEGGTSVSGTSSSANGTVIKVYIDGVLLGSTTVSGGTWTLSGLSAANYDLYAGGRLTATATETGRTEGSSSPSVTVACAPPLNKTLNALTNEICESTSAQVQVLNSEPGVIYTLRNASNTANLSSSLLGTGNNITFNSFILTANQTVQLQALKIPLTSCNMLSSSTVPITVAPRPPVNNALSFASAASGSPGSVNVANTSSGFSYQLQDNATNANIGSAVTSTASGSTVSLPIGSPSSTTIYQVLVTDATRPTNCTSRLNATYTYTPLPVELLYFRASSAGMHVQLSWATASEHNNSFFTVEKSKDGTVFHELVRVKASGNSMHIEQYTATDEELLRGTMYYRLKQTDIDQKTTYSKVVSVDNYAEADFNILPNPIRQNTICLQFNTSGQQVQVAVFDIFGTQLYGNNLVTPATGQLLIKDLPTALPPGVYMVEVWISGVGQWITKKMLVF
jgi:hypothetical protein